MRPAKALLLLSALLHGGYARPAASCEKAIYLQTNAVEGNSIVALLIGSDGVLGAGAVYPTMGKGGSRLDVMTMQPASPDALLSQSAIAVVGNNLFVINAMSNTASMFRINTSNATDLHYINSSPITGGDFPNTIAVSAKHKLVCVATTGKANGVSCATFDRNGLGTFDSLRPLGLTQSTPPTGPPNTVSQVSFTEDEEFLAVTVKADPPTNKPGFVAVYQVRGKKLAREAVRSSPADTAILFGFNQIPRTDKFIVTDPSIGAAILSLDTQSCDVTTVQPINITGQLATCWSVISPATGTAFVSDGAVNRLVEISVPKGDIVSVTDLSANGDPGLFDMVASGEFVYALSPATSAVTVVNAKSKKMVQHVTLGSLGIGAYAQGMALFEG